MLDRDDSCAVVAPDGAETPTMDSLADRENVVVVDGSAGGVVAPPSCLDELSH